MKKFNLDLAVLAAVLVFSAVIIRNDLAKLHEYGDKYEAVKKEILAQRQKKADLKKRLAELGNTGRIEVIARKKLGLIRPGEVPYKVVSPN